MTGFNYVPIGLDPSFPVSPLLHEVYRDEKPYGHPHLHDCFEIGYCHRGQGVFMIADKVAQVNAGDCVVINDREPHFAYNIPGIESDWTWIFLDPVLLLRENLLASLGVIADTALYCGSGFKNVYSQQTHPWLCVCAQKMVLELEQKSQHYQDAIRSLVYSFLIELRRTVPPQQKPLPESAISTTMQRSRLQNLGPALNHIAAHYNQPVSIAQLAHLSCMSESNFRRVFSGAMKVNPKRYINNLRIARSVADLKYTTASISEIARNNGYSDISCFNRDFKKTMHVSPLVWKKQ